MKGFYVAGGNGAVLILEDGRYVDTFVEETSEKNGATEDILLRLLTEMTDTLAEPPRSAPPPYTIT